MHTFENVIVFHSSMKHSEGKQNKVQSSGFVVLLLLTMTDSIECEDSIWTEKDINDLKKCKKNINTNKNQHYGSKGYYASFGMKANYATKPNRH